MATLDSKQVSLCFSLHWYVLGGTAIGLLVLIIAYNMAKQRISMRRGLLMIVILMATLIGFGYLSAMAGRNAKAAQDFEYEQLIKNGLSKSEALQAVYLEASKAI